MKIDRAAEAGGYDRIQTLPDVLRNRSRALLGVSIRDNRSTEEEAARDSLRRTPQIIEGQGTRLPAARGDAAGDTFPGLTGGDKVSLLSWVRTVRLVEGRYMRKGIYVDTFI
jgi:hypothetical protein